MNTTKKDTDQIAASTGKWLWNQRNKLSPSEFISRIKAAIEKATEAHKHAIEQDLPRRWESRLHEWERKQPFDSRTKLACDVLSECLTELRMSRAACASEQE